MILESLIGYDIWYDYVRKESQLRLPVIHVLVCYQESIEQEYSCIEEHRMIG